MWVLNPWLSNCIWFHCGCREDEVLPALFYPIYQDSREACLPSSKVNICWCYWAFRVRWLGQGNYWGRI